MNNRSLRAIFSISFIVLSAALLFVRPEINQIFIWQLSGIFFMSGAYLLCIQSAVKHREVTAILVLIGIAALHSIPSGSYPLFVVPVLILLIGFYFLLRIVGRTSLAALFGACIVACSSWIPLLFITGGASSEMLTLRDALIDPNQISVSHGAGGYVGVPGALFALAGVLIVVGMVVRKRFTPAKMEIIATLLLATSVFVTFVQSPVANPRVIVIVVACIAFLASLAFDKMQRFLGVRDAFIQTLMSILFCIALLDLMHITAQTFAYGLGI